jgi:hypothetical protein
VHSPVPGRASADPDGIGAIVTGAEWEFVLEAAKHSKDLAGCGRAAGKWRAFAYQELREPGAYFRVLATAAEVQRTGRAPAGSASGAGMRARIEARLADAGLPGTGRG